MYINAPEHVESGHLIVATKNGDLRLAFRENVIDQKIVADLWPEGDKCTGIYKNAKGELKFSLAVHPLGLAKGTYSGTLQLENPPPGK